MPMADPHALWHAILTHLREKLPAEEVESWLVPLQPLSLTSSELRLHAPSPIYTRYLEEQYLPLLEEAVVLAAGTPLHVVLTSTNTRDAETLPSFSFNSRYTFPTFVEGPSNAFARAAALAVASNPGSGYNPLFIYAGSGLGKTHLLHATGNHLRQTRPTLRLAYVPTEKFVNDLIHSIRLQKMNEFRQTYRQVDVLLLDDCHILAGKERCQEEFFHTFNTLHEAQKQIVLTSDTPPHNMSGLEERLRTRFAWGLVADIQPPDLETRIAIIREKAHLEGYELPNDVISFIAARSRENIRELEGYLHRLFVFMTLTGRPANLDTVRDALYPVLPTERSSTPQEIIRFVAHHYGVKVADLKGRDNRRSVAFPRQVAMYLLREVLNLSYPEIGRLFGKHHSTVLYSVEQVAAQRRKNPNLDATLTAFVEQFRT
ncbi:MAG: chromosomal replication initiator protein DnaA [Thermoanaerobaculum sp.]|nr:chromosomal replication initiator protein DnaA [Thermoanaerobaculum sp.]